MSKISDKGKEFIIQNSKDYTSWELAEIVGVSNTNVKFFLQKNNLKTSGESKHKNLSEFYVSNACPITGFRNF